MLYSKLNKLEYKDLKWIYKYMFNKSTNIQSKNKIKTELLKPLTKKYRMLSSTDELSVIDKFIKNTCYDIEFIFTQIEDEDTRGTIIKLSFKIIENSENKKEFQLKIEKELRKIFNTYLLFELRLIFNESLPLNLDNISFNTQNEIVCKFNERRILIGGFELKMYQLSKKLVDYYTEQYPRINKFNNVISATDGCFDDKHNLYDNKRKWYITICKNETPMQDVCIPRIQDVHVDLTKRLPILHDTLEKLKKL